MTTAAFASLSLAPALLQSLESLGYTEMTAIQQQSLPAMLSGKDILAKAKTGSGKRLRGCTGFNADNTGLNLSKER